MAATRLRWGGKKGLVEGGARREGGSVGRGPAAAQQAGRGWVSFPRRTRPHTGAGQGQGQGHTMHCSHPTSQPNGRTPQHMKSPCGNQSPSPLPHPHSSQGRETQRAPCQPATFPTGTQRPRTGFTPSQMDMENQCNPSRGLGTARKGRVGLTSPCPA